MTNHENYMEGRTFGKDDVLTKGEYENCTFNNRDFTSEGLSGYTFNNCTYNSCNLSLVKLHNTAFRNVTFKECKMLGLHFETCNEFGLSFLFDGCQLNHSSFHNANIKKTVFKNSQLQETDFSGADLTHAVFDNCNLAQAVFFRTTLERADFRTSQNYSIDPETNRIKNAKFSIWGISGLLDNHDIDIER